MEDEWLKIHKGRTGKPVNPRRKRPAVSRHPNTPNAAYMTIPDDMVTAERVSVYVSGDKIGFKFCEGGEFMVRETDQKTKIRRITIPSALAPMLPFGMHDVDLTPGPDGMLVLNCGTIGQE